MELILDKWTNHGTPTFLIFYFYNYLWYQSRGEATQLTRSTQTCSNASTPQVPAHIYFAFLLWHTLKPGLVCLGLKVGLASLMAYNWPGPKFWPGLKNRPGLIFGLYKKFWRHFFFFTFFIDFLHFKIRLIFLKLKTVFCLNYDTPDYHIDFELISVDLFN